MRIINRTNFKLPPDPWADLHIATADAKRVGTMMKAAINHQAMVSILGTRGIGKSRAINAVIRSSSLKLVEPLRLTRDKLHMGDIETAIVRELSDERPRRSGEARSHQVRRILGGATQDHSVLLMIDDAHVLHGHTLRSLKRLRELSWLGRSPLLGVVLIGQKDKTANIDEVRLRSDQFWLEGLTRGEISQILAQVLEARIDAAACKLIAKQPAARNWLDLQAIIDACIAEALARGDKGINVDSVNAVIDPRGSVAIENSKQIDDDTIAAHLQQKVA